MFPNGSTVRLVRNHGDDIPTDEQLIGQVEKTMESGDLMVIVTVDGETGFDFWPADECEL